MTEHESETEGKVLFEPGIISLTPGAMEMLKRHEVNPITLVVRHLTGDWGELDPEEVRENELSLQEGYRLFSSYQLDEVDKIYVITEWDRSATTLLRPDEY